MNFRKKSKQDDLEINLSDMPAKGYASYGQSWSIAIALRLAAFTSLREHDDDPILILDDVFAELDTGRRLRLASLVQDNEQVLITSAEINDVPEQLRATVFHVERGKVSKVQNG